MTIINDPIHGQITLSEEETAILDSLPMQRLRHIKQLTGTSFIFPSAQHARFDHSLGVMHIAGLYAEQLFPGEPERVAALRMAGLLHDIGHGPFSHQFDDTIYQLQGLFPRESHGHDLQRLRIIKEMDVPYYKEIEKIYKGESVIEKALIQGAIGADRIDFLLRDSYFTGTSHFGMVPVNRIVLNTRIIEPDNGTPQLALNWKLMDDILSSLIGRFMMFKNVYFHKAARAIDLLIQDLLSVAADDLNLVERTKNLSSFYYLTEPSLIGELLAMPVDSPAHILTKRIFFEKKWLKMVYERVIPTETIRQISEGADFSVLKEHKESWQKRFNLICTNIAKNDFINPVLETLPSEVREKIHLRPDTAYQMSFFDPSEFDFYDIQVYDPKHRISRQKGVVLPFSLAVKNMAFAPFIQHVKEFSLVRVYCESSDRKLVMETWKKISNNNQNDKKVDTSY
ncbi:MAG: HD domain-containing protein [Candidatus Odinarchaeota archaeon]